jgi:hypothetical protein
MFEIWDIFIGHGEFLVIEVAQKWQQLGLLFAFSFNIFFHFTLNKLLKTFLL